MIAVLRRNTELGLMLLGALITGGAYALGSLGRLSTMPADIVPFLVVFLGLLLTAHVATRILAKGADGTLLPLAALLNGIGYVFIARLDPDLAALQATWTAVGVLAYIGTLVVVRRVRDLRRYQWTFAFVGLGLLMLPLVPGLGRTINGARIWVSLGPVNFQPGEFAKLALALFFAAYLVERRELLGRMLFRVGPLRLPEPRHLLPVVMAWGASLVVMVTQKDLGSSLLFFALFVVMLWVATERTSYVAMGGLMFGLGAALAFTQFSHVHERVDIWLNPWKDAQDSGYQVVQAAFAMAWGGIVGTGIGLGDPGRIPYAETDFIFAAIGEELGLVGATAILAAFVLLIGVGLRTAIRSDHPEPFEKLLAVGITTIIGVQAFIIIGGVVRLVPLTGVTLPFVSYGGSSLVVNYILLALLVRISDDNARRAGEVPERDPQDPAAPRRRRRLRRADAAALASAGANT